MTGLTLPAWRGLLEARWQRRLASVISLSVAYHDASERSGGQADTPQVRRLMLETVAARRALSDTEEALARLSAGSYGRCEQCGASIGVEELLAEPEARYCGCCIRQGRRRGEVPEWRG